ncbi:hypothetical protein HY797_02325 [Candidatus Falkowbacteria bacterium]|nr:hypothetical protein [Candidatus Falkowbacteria bacterium]
MKKNLLIIIDLIKNSEIFSDAEKIFWLEVLPCLNDKQKNNFYEMLFKGSEKNRILKLQQIKQKLDLKNKQILEWRNIINRENNKTGKFIKAKIKEREKTEIKSILSKLKNE